MRGIRSMKAPAVAVLAAMVLATILVGCIPQPWAVDTTADLADPTPGDGICGTGAAGTCSLRAAIQEANQADGPIAITLTPATYRLTIPGPVEGDAVTGDLDIRGDLTINGNGATIDGNDLDRVIDIWAGGTLNLSNATVTRGYANGVGANYEGGAIRTRGTLNLTTSTLTGNRSTRAGGAISVDVDPASPSPGVANITASTIDHNTAPKGGGVVTNGETTILSSTLSANTITDRVSPTGTTVLQRAGRVDLRWSTVVDEELRYGDGAILQTLGGVGTLTGTLIYRRYGFGCSGPWQSGGQNMSNADCALRGVNDRINNVFFDRIVDMQFALGPLADNGGPTRTHLPLDPSDLINPPGSTGCPPVDQRLLPRPQDACEAGAVEASVRGPATFTVTVEDDAVDATPGDGTCADAAGRCTLRAAVQEANTTRARDTITAGVGVRPALTVAGSEEDAALAGDLDVLWPATFSGIDVRGGPGWNDRIFEIRHVGAPVVIEGSTISGGRAAVQGSGIRIEREAEATIRSSTITGNTITTTTSCGTWSQNMYCDSPGGGAVWSIGWLTVVSSEITGNLADGSTQCTDVPNPMIGGTETQCTTPRVAGVVVEYSLPTRFENSFVRDNIRNPAGDPRPLPVRTNSWFYNPSTVTVVGGSVLP